MKKKIYYWTPSISKVGTIKTTLNSAIALAKFQKDYEIKILNVFGEWSKYKVFLKRYNVEVEDLTFDYYNFLPKKGFLLSRLSYIIIILISLFPLIIFLRKKKPEFLIIHLLTSLPLILWSVFNLKTELIFRISGYVRLNYFRKKLWNISEKKIFKILCQTEQQKKLLLENNIFNKNKLFLIPDSIINVKEFLNKRNISNIAKKVTDEKNYFLAAGRFTRQKNFIYLIKEFKKFCNIYPDEKLLIFGEGEQQKIMQEEIDKNNLSGSIKIYGFTEYIYYYMKSSKAFILSSKWEEVGLVIVEAAMCNSFVISSNCKNGPEEFLYDGKAGLLFENNVEDKLFQKLVQFKKLTKSQILEKKVLAKKNCKKFSMFRVSLKLKDIIENQKLVN